MACFGTFSTASLYPYRMKFLPLAVLVFFVILAVIAGIAIAFGGPTDPPPMPSINDPFKDLDYSDLPTPSHFVARDGARLTFRTYASAGGDAKGSVVLVHGSSA